jgi:hypothetical protein
MVEFCGHSLNGISVRSVAWVDLSGEELIVVALVANQKHGGSK